MTPRSRVFVWRGTSHAAPGTSRRTSSRRRTHVASQAGRLSASAVRRASSPRNAVLVASPAALRAPAARRLRVCPLFTTRRRGAARAPARNPRRSAPLNIATAPLIVAPGQRPQAPAVFGRRRPVAGAHSPICCFTSSLPRIHSGSVRSVVVVSTRVEILDLSQRTCRLPRCTRLTIALRSKNGSDPLDERRGQSDRISGDARERVRARATDRASTDSMRRRRRDPRRSAGSDSDGRAGARPQALRKVVGQRRRAAVSSRR